MSKTSATSGGAAPVVGSVVAEGAGATAFQAQIAELTRMSAEATARSVELRVVTTNLQTIKKAADERVQ
ncbi:hypothetical protein [Rhizobium etli]|uniref:hypothetical protein n=1 Tax=Rhizobium etli TaxID=29449 RepID=UPI0005A16104|nr:hypothetical protein [Rhizobium etli]